MLTNIFLRKKNAMKRSQISSRGKSRSCNSLQISSGGRTSHATLTNVIRRKKQNMQRSQMSSGGKSKTYNASALLSYDQFPFYITEFYVCFQILAAPLPGLVQRPNLAIRRRWDPTGHALRHFRYSHRKGRHSTFQPAEKINLLSIILILELVKNIRITAVSHFLNSLSLHLSTERGGYSACREGANLSTERGGYCACREGASLINVDPP